MLEKKKIREWILNSEKLWLAVQGETRELHKRGQKKKREGEREGPIK